MSLESGQRLAHYEILEPIGKGGMGEVFRAKDRTLGRDVAIKVLPEEFARDAERLARFKREAKVLASLNHPNIASIYGLERSGDTHYLVLELVPGETLAERIARGPIPVDEAIRIAMKIAEALEEAHEQGIVHRDLKPANIKITPDDEVKVLDFGLAKAFVDDTPGADSSMSPTITRDATRAGVIMGTAAYMSPEQAKGKHVDRRADVWAFGVVFYEMLTGRRAFSGDDVSDTLAAVLRAEPEWNALPSETDVALRNILHLCLTKDVKLRVRDIGDVRLAMDGAFDTASEGSYSRRALTPIAAVVAGLMIVTALAVWSLTRSEPPAPVTTKRFAIALPPEAELSMSGGTFFALSRDGSDLVYIGEGEAGPQLFRRSMHQLDVVPIRDTRGAMRPFFSPDGAWLGFFTNEGLEKVSLAGGPASTICDDPICRGARNARGGSWTLDERIVVGSRVGGLFIVSADGGAPEPLTTADEGKSHRYPVVLPRGRAILFTNTAPQGYEEARVALYVFESGEYRELFDGSIPRFASGHILFAREDSLWAVPFDENALEPRGDPFLVQEDVARLNRITIQFQVAHDGTLVYMTGSAGEAPTPVWVDREGRVDVLPGIPQDGYISVRVSPDGTRLALESFSTSDLWIYDVARGTLSRLTTDPARDNNPLWTLDGERVVFGSDREGPWGLFWVSADGTGDVERLLTDDVGLYLSPHAWTPDGSMLLFSGDYTGRLADIGMLSMTGDRDSEFLIQTEFVEAHPAVSPDGEWIAYTSMHSGRPEVYVERFPDLGDRRMISTAGGRLPLWSPDGRELFYTTLDNAKLMVVSIDAAPAFTAGAPDVWFEGNLLFAGHRRQSKKR